MIMKYVFFLLSFMLLAFAPVMAQSGTSKKEKSEKGGVKSASVKVYGNCGMCERRIEGALSDMNGVRSSAWDAETKMLSVEYDAKKVTLMEIKEKVASVGHDTDEVRAPDAVYDKLHGCCKYDRPVKL